MKDSFGVDLVTVQAGPTMFATSVVVWYAVNALLEGPTSVVLKEVNLWWCAWRANMVTASEPIRMEESRSWDAQTMNQPE